MNLPDVVAQFVAETRTFDGPIDTSTRKATEFGRTTERASLTARKALLAAGEAAEKAAVSQRAAAEAAEKLAKGEIKEAEAARVATQATRDLERANIAEREAAIAAAGAADKQADQYRQLARDAELAAAAQRLASLRAAGAVREHNAELGRLRQRFPEIEKDASGAFKLMTSAASTFGRGLDGVTSGLENVGGMGKVALPAVLVGLQLLPAAAAAAGGGITLGLGGALTLIGIKAQASNTQVKREFSDMRAHVTAELQQISLPFHDTLLAIPHDVQTAFDELAPGLQHSFALAAPAVTRFSHETASSVGELEPAVESVGVAFDRTLGALGNRMPTIMHDLDVSIEAVTDAVAQNPEAIADFAEGISKIARGAGDTIGFLIRYESQIHHLISAMNALALGPIGVVNHGLSAVGLAAHSTGDTADRLAAKLGLTGKNLTGVGGAAADAGRSTTQTGMATRQLMTAQQAATMSSTQLKNALDALTSANQNAFDSTTNYKAALLAANAQAKSNNAGIHGMSSAAVDNARSLSQLASAIKDVETKTHPTAAAIAAMRARFIAAAVGMGVSRREAITLADKLLGVRDAANKIPKSKTTKVTADTHTAMSHLDAFLARVNRIPTNRQLRVDVRYNGLRPDLGATGGLYRGPGKGFRYAAGGEVSGLVSGPGTGTSDDVSAPWLSNGEFVVRQNVTRENTAALMALNAGMSWMRAGMLAGERFAKGGKVKSVLHAPTKTAAAHFAAAKARPEELTALAAQSSLSLMRGSASGAMSAAGLVGAGSGRATTVMHVTNVTLNVAGSIRSDRDIVRMVQQHTLTGRKPMNLPAGR